MSSTVSDKTARPLTGNPATRICSLDSVRIVATGSFTPEQIVTNADLAQLGYDADWIIQRTGIRERRHAEPDVATSDMAYEAARRCIEQLDANPDEIDLLIVATMTPDSPIPSTACLVQEKLGIRAAAMDLNAACAGFMYGLVTGMQFIQSGTSQLALIVGADTNSRVVNPLDRKTFPLFGDGAGAVLLGSQPDGGSDCKDQSSASTIFTLGADGSGKDLLKLPAGGSRMPITADNVASGQQYLAMDGRSVFKWAVRTLEETVRNVLVYAGLTVNDLDWIVLHQANLRIIDAAAEALGISRDRIVINLDRLGNTSAASIPIGLDEAVRDGRIKAGDRVLLCGFGAGLAWGTAIIRW